MHVAMVSEHASPLATLGGVDAGGQNVFVAALSRELARRGIEVTVYTRRDGAELPRRVEMCDGVTVEHVSAGPPSPLPKDELFPFMAEFAASLRRRWRRDRPDVVHAHFWMSGYASLEAARALGIPVAQTFHALGTVKRRHQGGMDTSPPERLAVERRIAQTADRILPTCSDEVFELLRLGADYDRLTVVPCGVDLDLFTPDGPVDVNPSGRHRLLYVGRLVKRKGIGNIVSALRQLPGVELVVAGGPDAADLPRDPEYSRLKGLAERYGVDDHVDFRGRVKREDLPALMRSAEALVSVPWYEPFGIAPLEAMACGVPVIASAVGGMIDSVVDGSTGVHVPPRDPDRLAEAVRHLLADPARRREYGRKGIDRARRLYGWKRIGDETVSVYEALRRNDAPTTAGRAGISSSRAHLMEVSAAVDALEASCDAVDSWGDDLADRLLGGARLLAVGNGGSAAEAEHLTAELVGRFESDRKPLSAIPLHVDGASLTAIGNDFGAAHAFSRQVEAHGRPGDILVAFSTSGCSENVLQAVAAARAAGMMVLGITGPKPNPLAEATDGTLACAGQNTATIQEMHLVAIHLLCGAIDRRIKLIERQGRQPPEAVPASPKNDASHVVPAGDAR